MCVVGREAKHLSPDNALDCLLGYTTGNDVSERSWQANDLQWLRAKASDTFGPLGPAIVTGLDYLDLRVSTRLNGETMQDQSTVDHIHDVHAILSFVSRYVTLDPGDIIYTGTPGSTAAMKPGDVVEIEVEGVGVLRNRVVAAVGPVPMRAVVTAAIMVRRAGARIVVAYFEAMLVDVSVVRMVQVAVVQVVDVALMPDRLMSAIG